MGKGTGRWHRYVDIEGEDGSVLRIPLVDRHNERKHTQDAKSRFMRLAATRKDEQREAREVKRALREARGRLAIDF